MSVRLGECMSKEHSVVLTAELKKQAYDIATMYSPLDRVQLTGSCYWLGEGEDLDIIVLCADPYTQREGATRCGVTDYKDGVAWRHGQINVIAMHDRTEYHAWCFASKVMNDVPPICIESKEMRVSLFKHLYEKGMASGKIYGKALDFYPPNAKDAA